ncbi:Sedlin, N-terminal conserved region-domain-containing protein, partial [Dipodascopsis uninucleata]
MPTKIYLVALMGRENNPLYVKSFQSDQLPIEGITDDASAVGALESRVAARDVDLRYEFLAHISLDVFAARLPHKTADSDFGLLFVQDGIALYGWMTNTGVKIVLGFSSGEVVGSEIRGIFRAIHFAYISLACNPFYSIDERKPINSRKFELSIRRIVDAWNGTPTVVSTRTPTVAVSLGSVPTESASAISDTGADSNASASSGGDNGIYLKAATLSENITLSYSDSRTGSPAP